MMEEMMQECHIASFVKSVPVVYSLWLCYGFVKVLGKEFKYLSV